METKPMAKWLRSSLWGIAVIILLLVVLSWFIDYPKWLDQLVTNILLIGLGLVMLFKAWQIRNKDRKFASVYLIIGGALIVITLLSFTFIKIVAVIALVVFLLSNRSVQNIINKKEDIQR